MGVIDKAEDADRFGDIDSKGVNVTRREFELHIVSVFEERPDTLTRADRDIEADFESLVDAVASTELKAVSDGGGEMLGEPL